MFVFIGHENVKVRSRSGRNSGSLIPGSGTLSNCRLFTPGPDREEERDVGVQGPEGGQWPGPSPSKQPIGRHLLASS